MLYHRYYSLVIRFFLCMGCLVTFSYGMEHSSLITIEDYHGLLVSIPKATAQKCKTLNDISTDCDKDTVQFHDPFKTKEFDFGFGEKQEAICSLAMPDIRFFGIKAGEVPLTKIALSSALEYIKDPKKCSSISKERIRSIFFVINFLNPTKTKVLKKLSLKMKTIIPRKELNQENEIDRIVLSGLYGKTLEEWLKNKNAINCRNGYLNLSNTPINSLRGLSHFKNQYIHTLYIDNTLLTTLNIKDILECLPCVNGIIAANGIITEFITPEHLDHTHSLEVNLDNNDIKEFSSFSSERSCNITLTNNPLSENAHQIIDALTKPTFIQSVRNNKMDYAKSISLGALVGISLAMLCGVPLIRLAYCNYNEQTQGYNAIILILSGGIICVPYCFPVPIALSLYNHLHSTFLHIFRYPLHQDEIQCSKVINGAILASSLFFGGLICCGYYQELIKKNKITIQR